MSAWKLVNANPHVTLDVTASDAGLIAGSLTSGANVYTVAGSWAASNSMPGRHASVFSVAGATTASAPCFVAAVGIMKGPGSAPASIDLQVVESSSADGSVVEHRVTLLPG